MKKKDKFIIAALLSVTLMAVGFWGAAIVQFSNDARHAAEAQSIEVRAENKHLMLQLSSTELDRDKWREVAETLSKIDAEQAAQVQKKNDAMEAAEARFKKSNKEFLENLERQKGKSRSINEILGIEN